MLGAPAGNILHTLGGSARARRTVATRAVATTVGGSGVHIARKSRVRQEGRKQEDKNQVHFF